MNRFFLCTSFTVLHVFVLTFFKHFFETLSPLFCPYNILSEHLKKTLDLCKLYPKIGNFVSYIHTSTNTRYMFGSGQSWCQRCQQGLDLRGWGAVRPLSAAFEHEDTGPPHKHELPHLRVPSDTHTELQSAPLNT